MSPAPAGARRPRRAASRKAEAVRRLTRGYLPHALSRLMNALNLELLEVLRPLDLSTQQFRVMQVVYVREGVTITEIARDAVIEQSVVSRIVDQLERRGFVSRRRGAVNGRIVQVTMTAVGEAVFESVLPHAHAIVGHATEVLSDSDAATLFDLLSRILRHVRPSAGGPEAAG